LDSDPLDFYNKFREKLLADFYHGNPRLESAIYFACRQLAKSTPGRIIDIGSGLGWSTHEMLRAMPDCHAVGVDLSPALTELASALFGDNRNAEFICQDITDVAWAEHFKSNFDACVMLDVYEHVPRALRSGFHESLASLLSDHAKLIITCPTPMHQNYLRTEKPEGLQPVDEDVTFEDLLVLAHDLGASISHFEYKSIWASNDYLHAEISRNVTRTSRCDNNSRHVLMKKTERAGRMAAAGNLIPSRLRDEITGGQQAFVRRIARIVKKWFLKKPWHP